MRLRFGEVTFDQDSRLLLRGPDPVHLTGKAFDLLALLLKERPRAVSREKLIGALWPDAFVTESNLTSLVNDVRSAIGDGRRLDGPLPLHDGERLRIGSVDLVFRAASDSASTVTVP